MNLKLDEFLEKTGDLSKKKIVIAGETWKYIEGYSMYLASDKGGIYSLHGSIGKHLKQSVFSNGYRFVTLCDGKGKQRKVTVHRVIASLFIDGFYDSCVIDHIDGDKLNNSASNLRIGSHKENSMAYRKKAKGKHSRYRGVSYKKDKNKWTAQTHEGGKKKHLGYFENEKEAAVAYNKRILKLGYSESALNKVK